MPDMGDAPGRKAWRRFRRNRTAVLGMAVLLVAMAGSVLGPLLVSHAPNAPGELPFDPPGSAHWMGSDIHGRDLLSRLWMSTRISLVVGGVGALLSLLIGVSWGMIAAYAGGRLDAMMMRAVDVLYALPNLVFVMLVMSVFESAIAGRLASGAPSLAPMARMVLLVGCLGAVSWLTMARIVRGQVLVLRERPFVLASRALGTRPWRILVRHILPNIAGVVIVYLTLTVPAVVLQESFLSFLGLGVRPPQASLGTLIADGATQLNPVRMRLWLLAFPAGMLALLLTALNWVGDGLRDAFDARERSR